MTAATVEFALPEHVAIIMDGNGRWATERGLSRVLGHRKGGEVVIDIVQAAHEMGVRCLSLYAFSTENWSRPKPEVRALMALLTWLLPRQIKRMMNEGVRLSTLGDVSVLPQRAQRVLNDAVLKTQHNTGIRVVLCLNYGGQQEILTAVKKLYAWAEHQAQPQEALADVGVEAFRSWMWRSDLPVVDLMIRTGGEQRISNFHLWDAAYAELYFDDVFWPDYTAEHLRNALVSFSQRQRRFGKTGEQMQS